MRAGCNLVCRPPWWQLMSLSSRPAAAHTIDSCCCGAHRVGRQVLEHMHLHLPKLPAGVQYNCAWGSNNCWLQHHWQQQVVCYGSATEFQLSMAALLCNAAQVAQVAQVALVATMAFLALYNVDGQQIALIKHIFEPCPVRAVARA